MDATVRAFSRIIGEPSDAIDPVCCVIYVAARALADRHQCRSPVSTRKTKQHEVRATANRFWHRTPARRGSMKQVEGRGEGRKEEEEEKKKRKKKKNIYINVVSN